ncbi:MAG: methyltransferase domain-containing protein [Puia sp.]|nr:methyltransferase domain-containing protein [Puia sp.]
MLQKTSAEKWFYSDKEFNALYPLSIQALSRHHWTPLPIAMKAARFLAGDEAVSILDIGSGVGKFCLAAAYLTPHAVYYGVEQRKSLIDYAEAAKSKLQLENVFFIHGNFTQLDLKKYDHFYFYNAFYENLDGTDKIDDSIDYSGELYNYYNRYLFRQLQQKPKGTRLCTLCSLESEVPPDFQVVYSDMNDLLKCWVKI